VRAKVHRWGNSLAVRIPTAFAREACLVEDSQVDITLDHGRIVLTPALEDGPTLEELLSGITEENRHGEVEMGPAVGNEAW
jgi:antitoxin MazE